MALCYVVLRKGNCEFRCCSELKEKFHPMGGTDDATVNPPCNWYQFIGETFADVRAALRYMLIFGAMIAAVMAIRGFLIH
jgi:hypothetical protein